MNTASKTMPVTLASHIGIRNKVPVNLLLIPLLANAPGRSVADGPDSWAPLSMWETQMDGAPDARILPGPALGTGHME